MTDLGLLALAVWSLALLWVFVRWARERWRQRQEERRLLTKWRTPVA